MVVLVTQENFESTAVKLFEHQNTRASSVILLCILGYVYKYRYILDL